MAFCNATTTLLSLKTQLLADSCLKTDNEHQKCAQVTYCALVGKVMYLANTTHPDLSFAVWELARFMLNYGKKHWVTVKALLCYLQGTYLLKLTFSNINDPLPLFCGFTDFDYTGSKACKLISDYVVLMEDLSIV